jgi:hypothetical protein
MARECKCGCGEPVEGRKKFVNDAHRQRAGRFRRWLRREVPSECNPSRDWDAEPVVDVDKIVSRPDGRDADVVFEHGRAVDAAEYEDERGWREIQ